MLDGGLALGYCRACDEAHHYPRLICPICGGTDTEVVKSAGRGTILSSTSTRIGSPDRPIIHAFVTLDEGVTLLTRIIGCEPEAAAIGAPVTVVFNDDLGGAPQFVVEDAQRP